MAACSLLSGVTAAEEIKLPEKIEFNRDIRPILSNACFTCHGPDSNTLEADLRLDQEAEAKADRGGYFAVAPGNPDESELIYRITADDEDERMPPPDSLHKLSPRQIALLTKWIEQGAAYQEHWSLIAPKKADPPQLEPVRVLGAGDWTAHPIDRFLLRRMRIEGVEPSPRADRRVLLRRLTFDMLGLPPTPEEVAAFVNDDATNAYEQVVDRLLADEAYGERMAIHWLDVVRYADSCGIHGDQPIPVSPYRDYVINAFNENMQFDRFTREQLAGDLIENATLDQKVASGFNRLNMMTAEGGAQPKEYLAKYAADRVRNNTTIFLGATMGCAECHDHKFDPYTAKDFYSFAAFFADIQEQGVYGGANWKPTIDVPDAEYEQQSKQLETKIAELQQQLDAGTPELVQAQAAWEKELSEGTAAWTVAEAKQLGSSAGTELESAADGVIAATGGQERDTYTITLPVDGKVTAIRLEVLADASLPGGGPGLANNGNFVLSELQLFAGDKQLALDQTVATHSQASYVIASAIDGDPGTGWAILPQAGKSLTAVFTLREPEQFAAGGELTVTMAFQYGSQHKIGRFRLATSNQAADIALGADNIPPEVRQLLAVPPQQRNEQQRDALAVYYRGIAPQLSDLRDQLEAVNRQHAELSKQNSRQSLVSVSVRPREMRLLPRGNWLDDSGPVMQPDTPDVLFKLDVGDRRQTRMDLAEWIVDRRNPMTARAFVNRLWKLYMGRGLATPLDDLGSQGNLPTHPELLDWLAVEFIDSGWDVKHMVRLIVTSEAYRQSSQPREELLKADPFNQLLARQARFRLPAEVIRDNALATSGLLVKQIGGPSVYPYQPPGYWGHLNFPKRTYPQSQGDDLYRRSVYTHWQRQYLHPAMLAFDASTREECTVERPVSNTPLQALVLLNDPQFVETARVLAAKMLREAEPSAESRVDYLVKQVLMRAPSEEERQILITIQQKHQQEYAENVDGAKQLVATGAAAAPPDLDPAEWAAWTSVARIIYNLQETINRY
ncbi:MAG: PSD1 and planctomycete cytochrome C domain-containing protein [Pirellulales bacterium]